jgi:hypothetical protein
MAFFVVHGPREDIKGEVMPVTEREMPAEQTIESGARREPPREKEDPRDGPADTGESDQRTPEEAGYGYGV